MRRLWIVAACSVWLVACGGSDGSEFKDPDSVSFTFGTPAEPAAGSDEEYAAEHLGYGLADASDIRAPGASDEQLAEDVAGLAGRVGGQLFGVGLMAARAEQATGLSARALAAAALAGRVGDSVPDWDDPGCWSVSAAEVRFDDCTITQGDDTGSMVQRVDGALHRSAGRVYWDFSMRMTISETSEAGSAKIVYSNRLSGDLAFGAGTVEGFSRSDLGFDAATPKLTDAFKVTYNLDLDLQYLADPALCLTGGTLVAKRIWTDRPTSDLIDPEDQTDVAVRFTWTENGGACSEELLVAWGTPE